MRVATWNIAGLHGTFELAKTAAVLRAQDCNVICLQEVGDAHCGDFLTQAHALAAALRMNCVFAQAHQRRVFGNAILSRHPLHSAVEIELPCGSPLRDPTPGSSSPPDRMPGAKERRVALAVTVSPLRDDASRDFTCISTHFGIFNRADREQGKHKVGVVAFATLLAMRGGNKHPPSSAATSTRSPARTR